MRIAAVLLATALFVAMACLVMAKGITVTDEGIQKEAAKGFEQLLDLWRDGRYDELYDRTFGGGESRERFAARLAAAPLKPACCWEMMQDVKVSAGKGNRATLKARIGLEGGVNGDSATRSFRLIKEDGVWKASRSEIISLSGSAKKKKRLIKMR
jgi:hypothetical protein